MPVHQSNPAKLGASKQHAALRLRQRRLQMLGSDMLSSRRGMLGSRGAPRVPTPSVSAHRLVRSRRLAPIPVLVIANRNTPATHASCVLTPSTPPPPQTVVDVREVSTRRAMSGWYKRMMSFALLTVASSAVAAVSWRAPTGSTLAVLGTSMAPEDWTSDDRCIVYTYFDEVEGMDDQNEIIESWAKTWSEAGWKPVIIGEVHARRHPRYDEFRARFAAMPTPNPSEYELACYLRHVAMAVVGGGYLADYDTLNVNVPPPPQCGYLPNGGALTVHQEGSFTDFEHKPMERRPRAHLRQRDRLRGVRELHERGGRRRRD